MRKKSNRTKKQTTANMPVIGKLFYPVNQITAMKQVLAFVLFTLLVGCNSELVDQLRKENEDLKTQLEDCHKELSSARNDCEDLRSVNNDSQIAADSARALAVKYRDLLMKCQGE